MGRACHIASGWGEKRASAREAGLLHLPDRLARRHRPLGCKSGAPWTSEGLQNPQAPDRPKGLLRMPRPTQTSKSRGLWEGLEWFRRWVFPGSHLENVLVLFRGTWLPPPGHWSWIHFYGRPRGHACMCPSSTVLPPVMSRDLGCLPWSLSHGPGGMSLWKCWCPYSVQADSAPVLGAGVAVKPWGMSRGPAV